jgi:hypothetical protein
MFLQYFAEFQRIGFYFRAQLDQVELVIAVKDDHLVVAVRHHDASDLEVQALGAVDLLGGDVDEREAEVSLQLGEDADVFVVVDQVETEHFLLFLQVGEHESVGVAFAEVFEGEGGVGLGGRAHCVQDVVVQHQVFEVFEAGDLLILSEAVDDLLVFGEHVVEDDLFAENVHDFVVVDGLRAGEGGGLVKPEALFEGESYSVLQVAAFVEHGFAFLSRWGGTSREVRD